MLMMRFAMQVQTTASSEAVVPEDVNYRDAVTELSARENNVMAVVDVQAH